MRDEAPEITPALSPEEWAEVLTHGSTDLPERPDPDGTDWSRLGLSTDVPGGVYVEEFSAREFGRSGASAVHIHPQARHALAALCLYGQPFGFTHEDVSLLRDLLSELPASAYDDGTDERLYRLASRLAALLPPTADDGTTP